MDRYLPLKTNATTASVLLIDTNAQTSQLLENALLRIRTGTGLLELLASASIQCSSDKDLSRLLLSAYLPLQDGLDLLEHFQSQT
ncbi:hypothetical protein [Pseudomonas fluorescens]|uniref:hypothetical protein n=1 Tax=Pseudomonas fluorescens TaxID=294 RepID=UPI00123FE03D|nr:hypothetical protein [Pseudomonas fluorescens]